MAYAEETYPWYYRRRANRSITVRLYDNKFNRLYFYSTINRPNDSTRREKHVGAKTINGKNNRNEIKRQRDNDAYAKTKDET